LAAWTKPTFPTVGVILVANVVALGLLHDILGLGPFGEFVQRGALNTAVRCIQLVLDMAFLAAVTHVMVLRGWPLGRVAVLALPLNLLAVTTAFAASHLAFVARGVPEMDHFSVITWLRDAALPSMSQCALWILGFQYPAVVRSAGARAVETERLRVQAELLQLRSHLQPHFLLNTLNAIAALVTKDPREARRLLAALGELLSDSLQATGPQHRLEKELAWLRRYARILEARHYGALVFVWDVSPDASRADVPTLLLQPIVENAVLHGALSRNGGGEVTLRARARQGGGITIVVEDNGPGFDPTVVRAGALGLHIVRRRLALECPGADFRFESSGTGTRAVLELPRAVASTTRTR
jgi:signal transduction histidine kinase